MRFRAHFHTTMCVGGPRINTQRLNKLIESFCLKKIIINNKNNQMVGREIL